MAALGALERGWQALQRWSWHEARAAFEEALADEETPEGLEGLGAAASWLDDGAVAIDARARSYRLFRERGEIERAARAAAAIANDVLTFRGDVAVASGWLQRARHVLAERPESPVLAWLDVLEAFLATAYERDIPRALAHGEAALARSRSLGDVDGEMVALSILGVANVTGGRFTEGMRALDEATAAAVSGEIRDPEAAANVCCALVTASVRVRDFERLAQWSEYAMQLARDWSNRALFSYPRTEHAVALVCWGRWSEAEEELVGVIADMERRPLLAALATLRLADLRRRQGRLDEAAELVHRLEERVNGVGMGHLTGAVAAAVALDRGDPEGAAAQAERYLRRIPASDVVERIDGLEVLVRARAALGDTERAADTASELAVIAETIPTGHVRAAARLASGLVAAARHDHVSALAPFEEAVELYERGGASFDAARARVVLARALLALGGTEHAVDEAKAALSVFERLGARRDLESARELLDSLGSASRRQRVDLPLTPRELEVLRLVASGRSNEEIASALVLSVRTVERHVSNIYSKIGASGRTARAVATAYAHTHALT